MESSSTHFTDIRSSDTDSKIEECVNNAYPLRMLMPAMNIGSTDDEGESILEPYVGLAFDSADGAREFYTLYAARTGFKVRIGQLYRSRTDGTVSARRFVCSKEGFQTSTRTGCAALIRVQRRDSGKWVIDLFLKNHNHDLGPTEGNHSLILQQKILTAKPVEVFHRPKNKLIEEVEDGRPCPSGVITAKRSKPNGDEMQCEVQPSAGLGFNSANEAYQFYHAYAENAGFRIRIGQLFRSKLDGSITSRRFVCSREGFQHPSRVGCGAFMRIKRQESGRWVVDRLEKHHNHELESRHEVQKKNLSASKKFIEEENGGLDDEDIVDINNGNLVKRRRENHIGSDWYTVLFDYFQTKQAEDTGFFYAVEVDSGSCMSIFWADGRSRFSCSQFGDAIIFDTSYRKGIYLVPFATFIGINHNRQPVLLGCALIADESEMSFTWLFQTWLRAMSGRRPVSIIADQDNAIQEAIIQVFPGTHHRFSMWQIKAKECEHLSSVHSSFHFEYGKCINQSQTSDEFDTAWNSLLCRYGLKDNTWLKAMYEKRQCWVPLFLRATFFAGIPLNGNIESFFGTHVNAQTPLTEFVPRYEKGLERRREEELKENFNCSILNAYLQTKEPVEEQCRRLYTLNIFRIFQKELLQSYSYLGFKIDEEVDIVRYLVRKCGNGDDDKSTVTIRVSNHNVGCSCQMFEFEGVLCRHVLRVFQILEIKEVPSRYILRRWRKNAEYGLPPYSESGGRPQEVNASMVWSLREEAWKYIEAGATSLEKHRLAYEILHEGRLRLGCPPR
ncbi:putative transcription factor FAR family [Rosa chinensis]|uniref:Protein FAR1-RELATED SEQUENCE n=2 Tax=Rosa chinensis TaxID=74649 RepID=A0A2P6QXH9_ROSCH|nr:protein FAR1-RELATED SEQUENCE 7 isoform X1 [Rosa chinensis]PRQ38908.1 putative transcription factor FAR family [Rosa chinensis]